MENNIGQIVQELAMVVGIMELHHIIIQLIINLIYKWSKIGWTKYNGTIFKLIPANLEKYAAIFYN